MGLRGNTFRQIFVCVFVSFENLSCFTKNFTRLLFLTNSNLTGVVNARSSTCQTKQCRFHSRFAPSDTSGKRMWHMQQGAPAHTDAQVFADWREILLRKLSNKKQEIIVYNYYNIIVLWLSLKLYKRKLIYIQINIYK